MEQFLNFVVNHYVWFLVLSILLIFALIGYFVDIKRSKENPYKIEKQEEIDLGSLEVKENIALSDVLNKNKTVGGGTQAPEVTPVAPAQTNPVETLDNNQNAAQ